MDDKNKLELIKKICEIGKGFAKGMEDEEMELLADTLLDVINY
jgi:hypothetical protein